MTKRTKVLIIDDSALIRQLLTKILASDSSLEVVGAASDPLAAWEKIKSHRPDVITLDIEMPKMDGLTFLEKLMRVHPMPVLMVSSLTERGCEITLRALELGAIDFLTKPKIDVQTGTMSLAEEICAKVRAAARVVPRRNGHSTAQGLPQAQATAPRPWIKGTHKVIAIGASTGGTEALRQVLTAMPADSPGIVIVQHMPEKFTHAFAQRLDGLCRIRVREAVDGDRVLPGQALIAPGNYHMEVVRSGADYRVRVFMDEPVNRHRPSVDVLFHSCANQLASNSVGVILTGMGNDGARGMLAMREAGCHTIAQNEETCVVFGMPKEAIKLGGAEEVVALPAVPNMIQRLVARGS